MFSLPGVNSMAAGIEIPVWQFTRVASTERNEVLLKPPCPTPNPVMTQEDANAGMCFLWLTFSLLLQLLGLHMSECVCEDRHTAQK